MTMLLADVLPDRSSGFIATDTRLASLGPAGMEFQDSGGKIVRTPYGWASGACLADSSDAWQSVLLALRDHAPAPSINPVQRLTRTVRAALATVGFRGKPDDDSDLIIVVMELNDGKVFLVGFENGICTPTFTTALSGGGATLAEALAAGDGKIGIANAAESERRSNAFMNAIAAAPSDLATRIRLAAQAFVVSAEDSWNVSDVLEVAFLVSMPTPRRGFLRGRAKEMAEADPQELLARFAAIEPTRMPHELEESDHPWKRFEEMAAVGGTTAFQSANPLSSSGNVITIATHSVYFGGTATVMYTGGTVTVGGPPNTWYVYADDNSFAGGAVTYLASTTKATLSQSDDRYYVGQITTTAGTGTGVSGGGGAVRPV